MTPRQLRVQRKMWRVNSRRHYERKKKEKVIEHLILDNSPPVSDTEVCPAEKNPLASSSVNCVSSNSQSNSCQQCIKKDILLRKIRYQNKKKIGILKQELEKSKKEKEAIRKMLCRLINKTKNKNNTKEKINILVENRNINKQEKIKKKLIFGEILSASMKEGYKCLRKKDKKVFSDVIMTEKEKFKKYRLLTQTKLFTVRDNKNKEAGKRENLIEQEILEFFNDDAVTRIASDKKEYITKNKIRMQKRYLTDTLINLYKKFTHNGNAKVTYQTFCKYRPFWVLRPKDSDRNTCACKVHVNIDLLVKCLNINKILKETNGTAILEHMCCNVYDENCLNRICHKCKFKYLDYAEFRNDKKVKYYQWCSCYEKYYVKDDEKTKLVTKKETFYDFPKNIILKLENSLVDYLKHCNNIVTQFKNNKELKNNLTPQEAVIHIDFSENYCIKYNEEIQSFHFGGSRKQLSLHTCVIHLIDPEVGIKKQYSFSTVSECTQHDAAAVWAHLIPAIGYVIELSRQIDSIHFISDSPTSQYRNRFIFYMISQLYRDFPQLKSISWNYLEAGHGKGAPDGVGAVLKRTADQVVRFGSDIDSLEAFVACLKTRVNIEIRIVTRSDIKAKCFPSKLMAAKGTMTVHQALWSFGCSKISLRKLSCFMCSNEVMCSHGKHIGYYDIPSCDDEVNTSHFQRFLDENTTPELIKEINDTVFSNIRSNPSSSFENLSLRTHCSPKVKILSDLNVTDWENHNFYFNKDRQAKNILGSNKYQSHFEKFITNEDNNKENKDEKKEIATNFWSDDDEDIF
ncbi:unnamed protein product [Euphydryas editha]|uniref:Transposase n=1 Tax=Euphydryas editha TaxID=104508 RepID=A0AAU9UK84_EUPED|nr:unnamed protein product [Euphydryas editha]